MSLLYQPKYTSVDAVKKCLGSKVDFSNEDDRFLSDQDVVGFIETAEGYVERKLSRLYTTPFVATDGSVFSQISDSNTIKMIVDACTWYASILIIRTEFGDNTGSRGGTLYEYLKDSFKDFIETNTAVNEEGYPKYPPLTDLKLNPDAAFFQTEGLPMPMVAQVGACSNNIAIRAQKRMTNPTQSFLNSRLRGYWWGA